MTSVKQLNLAKKLNNERKLDFDEQEFAALSDNQASAVITELIEMPKKNGTAQKPAAKPQTQTEINDFCFGMCVKLIVYERGIGYALLEKEAFGVICEQLYKVVELTRSRIAASCPGA